MSKTEMIATITAHEKNIKGHKDDIRALSKAADIITAYADRNGSGELNEVLNKVYAEIEVLKTAISVNKEGIAKQKKKIALIEKLEALENE